MSLAGFTVVELGNGVFKLRSTGFIVHFGIRRPAVHIRTVLDRARHIKLSRNCHRAFGEPYHNLRNRSSEVGGFK